MGDPNVPKTTSVSLLPGFLFYPTEEQLFCYHLRNKNNCLYIPSTSATDLSPFGFELIKEIDFYNYDPLELPELACFPFGHGGIKKHWYCFTATVGSECAKREARGGFWKSMGPALDFVSETEGAVLGTKKTFVFFRGDSSSSVLTDWVMYEYALVDHREIAFVLCRVFLKSHGGNKVSEHLLSSCAGESVAVMHRPSKSVIAEVAVHEDNIVETDNEVPGFLMKLISEPDDLVMAGPVSDAGFQLPVGSPQPDEQVRPSDGNISGSGLTHGLLIDSAILEGDFIERFPPVEQRLMAKNSEKWIDVDGTSSLLDQFLWPFLLVVEIVFLVACTGKI
ncbi:hypothetical protein HHK36_009893 [Tetracentron sinense]|uniref:NAC domain-containing protein n=1 Tax=Tetracentron sinense TaxID=13715 RepID=A0A835DIL6_TETSI|nr:hypothetical protein HHK36_009893 [Tetracentron sinense]